MIKLCFSLLVLALPSWGCAQTAASGHSVQNGASQVETSVRTEAPLRFGYFSYDSVFHAMPEYVIAEENLDELRKKYDAEMKRSEDEFNAKYEEFLEGEKDFIPSIRQKRQSELQEMMDKNVAFKKEALRLLGKAREDAFAPLRAKIKNALQAVAKEGGYAFILNTDSDASPYIDPTIGHNVEPLLRSFLKIK